MIIEANSRCVIARLPEGGHYRFVVWLRGQKGVAFSSTDLVEARLWVAGLPAARRTSQLLRRPVESRLR